MPEVSVLIPSFNRRSLLPRALKSIEDQGFEDLEIIVVDDGSSDGTSEYLAKEASRNKRLKFFVHDVNKGEAAARNTAIQHATGKFIAFLDSDDEWLPRKLHRQYEFMQSKEGSQFDAVLTNAFVSDGENAEVADGWHRRLPITVENLMELGCALNLNNTIFMRRPSVVRAGPYDVDLKLFVDVDWFARYLMVSKVHFMDQPFAVYYKAPSRTGKAVKSAVSAFIVKNEGLRSSLGASVWRKARSMLYWSVADSYYSDGRKLEFLIFAVKSFFLNPFAPAYRVKSIVDVASFGLFRRLKRKV
ncbi:glycosyltransferase family 2 protein [Thalassospira lucentensis]|uniref:glycosyltransferase family 2 protein n=1 Tax=Thalassospira lucentensis TaxID=168935 RepID=UPI003D2C01FF